jgi:hypothetical protein
MSRINLAVLDAIDSHVSLLNGAKERIVKCLEKNDFGPAFKVRTELVIRQYYCIETLESLISEKHPVAVSVSDIRDAVSNLDYLIISSLGSTSDYRTAMEVAGYNMARSALIKIQVENPDT